MIWPLLRILKAEGKAKFNVQRLARKGEAEKGGKSFRLKARDMPVCKNENTNAVQLPWYDFVYPSLMLRLLIAFAYIVELNVRRASALVFITKPFREAFESAFLAHWAIKLIRYSTDLINLYICIQPRFDIVCLQFPFRIGNMCRTSVWLCRVFVLGRVDAFLFVPGKCYIVNVWEEDVVEGTPHRLLINNHSMNTKNENVSIVLNIQLNSINNFRPAYSSAAHSLSRLNDRIMLANGIQFIILYIRWNELSNHHLRLLLMRTIIPISLCSPPLGPASPAYK